YPSIYSVGKNYSSPKKLGEGFQFATSETLENIVCWKSESFNESHCIFPVKVIGVPLSKSCNPELSQWKRSVKRIVVFQ
ncbi:uncharacterized protein V6R79_005532, partial [Siganus canaliculatus]